MTDIENATVLIVDDTPANLSLLEKILSTEEYNVRALPSGELALASMKAALPDLILLDIKMPGMDGYETCAKLKENPLTRDIPVIFISALQETEDKIQAFAVGGVDYISKPFQAAEVLARVKTHLRLRTLQQGLEQARLRAEAANQAKSAFLANMSHELRTPLNAILGFARILQNDDSLGALQRRHARYIGQGGDFLLALINDILDLAKIEAGRFECYPDNWNTRGFLDEVIELFRIRAEQKGLFFQYEEITPLPAMLHGDAKRLRQIIINLLSNAIKFTQQGGITFRVGFETDCLRVEIEDTGLGIAPEMRQKIFEPFQQAGEGWQKSQGTGLGLAISLKLAKMMHGDLTVESVKGKGSTFRLSLPVEEVESPVEPDPREADLSRVIGFHRVRGEGAFRLLVSDDVQDYRDLMSILL